MDIYKLIDELTRMIGDNICQGTCSTEDEWRDEVERVVRENIND